MNGLKILCLKTVMKNCINPLLPSVAFLFPPQNKNMGNFLMFSDGIKRQ